MSTAMHRLWILTSLLEATLLTSPSIAQRAYHGPTPAGSMTGSVIDALTERPLPDASVILSAVRDSSAGAAERAATVVATAFTEAAGRYRFDDVPLGRYVLEVRRLGYKPTQVSIVLERLEPLGVSLALEVIPIVLEPEHVTAPIPWFGAQSTGGQAGGLRAAADDYRTARFLTGDARVLTHGDVLEAITLGEPDLFRAIQALPGVTTRDDYTAELWTRGAPWSHTRVYFDGLPIFNPVHAAGVFGAINLGAIGTVEFQPGVRTARIGEGAAAVLDLRSRPANDSRWSGHAELSAVSARATVDRRFADGNGEVMVAARRSHIDLLMEAVAGVTGDSSVRIPYAFVDAVARLRLPLGRASAIEMSGLFETDQLRGDVRNIIRGSEGSWGNATGRVMLITPIGSLVMRSTMGGTRFRGTLNPRSTELSADTTPTHLYMDNRLDYALLATEISPPDAPTGGGWAAGIQLIQQRQFYDGPFPRPYPSNLLLDVLRINDTRSTVGLWGEVRIPIVRALSADVGLRAEINDREASVRPVTISPRIAGRYELADGDLAFSAGYARSYQHTQALAPAGPGIGPELHLADVWLLSGANAPTIRSDVVTTGIEWRLSDNWLAQANAFVREAHGVAVPEPSPGVYTNIRPVFVGAINYASGLELSARKLRGRSTGSISVTYGSSRIRAQSSIVPRKFDYPAPTDRRVVVDATARRTMGRGFSVGGALSVATGAPFTRFIVQTLPCDSIAEPCGERPVELTIEEPNAERIPVYASLNLMADWQRRFPTWALGVFVQLRNVMNRRNAVTYTGSLGGCESSSETQIAITGGAGTCDLFDRGLPLLPFAGVTVAF